MRDTQTGTSSRETALTVAVSVAMLVTFALDLVTPRAVAIEAIYVLLVLATWFVRSQRSTVLAGIAAIVMTLAGLALAPGELTPQLTASHFIVATTLVPVTALISRAKMLEARQTLAFEATQRSEAALREGEARFRSLFEHSSSGVVITDIQDAIENCNAAFGALVGHAPLDLRGRRLSSLLHPDDVSPCAAALEALLRREDGSCELEHRYVRRDGSPVWVRTVCTRERDGTGRVSRVARFSSDISASKRTEGELQRSRDLGRELAESMETLLDTAAQGILSINGDGMIVAANPALESMFEWPKGELIGRSVNVLVPAAVHDVHDRHRKRYWAAPHARLGLELTGIRRDGTAFPVEVSLNYVNTRSGGQGIAFVTDITQRVRAAEELRRRAAQLSRLASELTVAEQHARERLAKTLHDHLQQLLFSAKLRLGRLEARQPPDLAPLCTGIGSVLDQAIAAARSLSVDLFPPVLHAQGLPSALAWLAARMEHEYGLRVSLSADADADLDGKDVRMLVFESVRELLFDVVKHAKVDQATVELTSNEDGHIRLVVSDDGVGFDPATVFGDASVQVGLGLFSIRERITLLGGQFEVDSQPGRGTRFTLSVPRRDPARARASEDTRKDEGAAAPAARGTGSVRERTLTILIVDDHAAVREGLREMLRDQPGLEVVGDASNGFEAIERTRMLRPDVIVIDVSMPEMDGVEATARIHAEFPRIQVFGLSTQERPDDLHAIEKVGAVGFFAKGVDTGRLVERLLQIRDDVLASRQV